QAEQLERRPAHPLRGPRREAHQGGTGMSRFVPLAALLAGLALLACAPGGEAAGPPAGSDAQKIGYLGDRGPLLIELRVRIDGNPFRSQHRAFMDHLFTYLDRDRDGMLSRAEAEAAPTAQSLTSGLGGLLFLRRVAPNQARLSARDGKVTRE